MFLNEGLNEMMEKYKENNINRDLMYEEDKREKIKMAQEERLKAEKLKMEEQSEKIEDINKDLETIVKDTKVDESLKNSLDEVDPWLQNKIDNVSSEDTEVKPEPEPEVEAEVKDCKQ